MGMSFTQCRYCGVLFERHLRAEHPCYADEKVRKAGYYINPDIQPYQSMKTGEMITSRKEHREHLKVHRLVELGNEPLKPPKKIEKTSCRDELGFAVHEALAKHQRESI